VGSHLSPFVLTEATIMLALVFAFGGTLWSTWAVLGAGAVAASLVLGSAGVYARWRQRLAHASREEDLEWDKLLGLLEQRNRDRAAAGLPPQQASEEELDEMLEELPNIPRKLRPVELPEDREFKPTAGSERRAGRRRWGNPTEVRISAGTLEFVHGIIVNRSTGGLGIYTNTEVEAGTFVTIRAIEAPTDVPSVLAEIRHCQKTGNGYILGCQFCNAIPWSVRVWFG
jgi:hypothetical protein